MTPTSTRPLILDPPCAQAPAYNAYQRAQAANVNLNGPVQEFCQRVRDWPQRRAGMAIAVRHIKQRDLPPSCFRDGARIILGPTPLSTRDEL